MARSGLGKGLGALISAPPSLRVPEAANGEQVQQVDLAALCPARSNRDANSTAKRSASWSIRSGSAESSNL